MSAQNSMHSVLDAIGNTPVVRLRRIVPGGHAQVFLKLEFLSPTGSYKDRMAKSMLEAAELRGELKPGMTVVEASAGSTGSSLAFISAIKGYNMKVVSSDVFANEKIRAMEALGAQVELIPSPSRKVDQDLITAMVRRAENIATDDDVFLSDQFNNRDALVGYGEIGRELLLQLPGGIDGFCGAFGTAGMVMGVAGVLKSRDPNTFVTVLEPENSPVATKGRSGSHRVEGIGAGFIPPHLNPHLYDEARAISEEKAFDMCRRLAREEGLLVGTSTGLNVAAALELAKELGPGKTVVTVACDTGLRYLNGDLYTDGQS